MDWYYSDFNPIFWGIKNNCLTNQVFTRTEEQNCGSRNNQKPTYLFYQSPCLELLETIHVCSSGSVCVCGGVKECGWNYLCWESVVFISHSWGLVEKRVYRPDFGQGEFGQGESLPPLPLGYVNVPESSIPKYQVSNHQGVGEEISVFLLLPLWVFSPSTWPFSSNGSLSLLASQQTGMFFKAGNPCGHWLIETTGNQFWNIAMKQAWVLQTCPQQETFSLLV